MTSSVDSHCNPLPPAFTRPHHAALAVLALVNLAVSGCSPNDHGPAPAANGDEVSLSAQQREQLHLYTVAPSRYHRSVEADGAVDFDNDQATGVLAPFSGPVARLLVAQGDQVKAGDALAVVDSPDFATAIGAYQKALSTAQTNRRLAEIDKDL